MALVSELLPKTRGARQQGQTKLYDWLYWNFPWLNVHHRDYGGETIARRDAASSSPQGYYRRDTVGRA